jgi:hypothetical protein
MFHKNKLFNKNNSIILENSIILQKFLQNTYVYTYILLQLNTEKEI